MKKNSKIILFTLSVFVIVISFLGTAAFADDNSNKVQPKDVKQGESLLIVKDIAMINTKL